MQDSVDKLIQDSAPHNEFNPFSRGQAMYPWQAPVSALLMPHRAVADPGAAAALNVGASRIDLLMRSLPIRDDRISRILFASRVRAPLALMFAGAALAVRPV